MRTQVPEKQIEKAQRLQTSRSKDLQTAVQELVGGPGQGDTAGRAGHEITVGGGVWQVADLDLE